MLYFHRSLMLVTPIPNWVDLIVVIIVFRTCYNGFVRGVVTELLYAVGAVAATVAAINFWPVLLALLLAWVPLAPSVLAPLVFWGVFLIGLGLIRFVLNRVSEMMKWERLHWTISGIGLLLGGARGLWWAGLVLLACVTSGFDYLQASVQERSVVGPRLIALFRQAVIEVSDRAPGAAHRTRTLLPPVKDDTGRS